MGWGGDRTLLFKSKGAERYALAAVTAWDTPADAAEFYSALRDLRRARQGSAPAFPDERRMTWATRSRSGYAAISGDQVALVITPDEGTTRKIRGILEADLFRGP